MAKLATMEVDLRVISPETLEGAVKLFWAAFDNVPADDAEYMDALMNLEDEIEERLANIRRRKNPSKP